MKLSISPNPHNTIYHDDNIVVIVGSGHFDPFIENRLIGITAGELLTVPINALSNVRYKTIQESVLSAKIVAVYRYTEEEDTADFLKQQNFSSFSDFYDYLFKLKRDELTYESFVEEKDAFFNAAFDKCTFSISEEDLKKMLPSNCDKA